MSPSATHDPSAAAGVPTNTHRRLREAHAHLAEYGRSLAMPNYAACATRAACLESLREHGERREAGWFMAQALRVEAWDDARYPTRQELDEIFADRPSVMLSFDYHAAVANTAAMAAAGVTPQSPDPAGGVIVRDRTGEATGLLLESAAKRVWQAASEPTREQRKSDVRLALGSLSTLGYVEVHDLLSQVWLGPILAELADAGELTQRVVMYAPMEDLDVAHASSKGWTRDRVHLGGGKLFADGTLNSTTAWMLHPYRNPMAGMERGKALQTVETIAAAISRCGSLGVELAVHAIGDGAVRACLDAWEAVHGRARERVKAAWASARAGGLRIEHCEVIDERDVARFAALGVVASVQPCHLLYDIEVLRRQLPDRVHRVMPLRELIASGLVPGETLLFGSDVPIVRPEPEDSIQAAVRRRRVGMSKGEAIGLEEAITEDDAWRAFGVRNAL